MDHIRVAHYGLYNHAGKPGKKWKFAHHFTNFGEVSFWCEGIEEIEHVDGAHDASFGRFGDEVEVFKVRDTQLSHSQYDFGKIGAIDLFGGKERSTFKFLSWVKPIADSRTGAPCPALSLVARRLRNRYLDKARRKSLGVVVIQFGKPGIDNDRNPIDGHARFRNICRNNDFRFAGRRWIKDLFLFVFSKPRVKRNHLQLIIKIRIGKALPTFFYGFFSWQKNKNVARLPLSATGKHSTYDGDYFFVKRFIAVAQAPNTVP